MSDFVSIDPRSLIDTLTPEGFVKPPPGSRNFSLRKYSKDTSFRCGNDVILVDKENCKEQCDEAPKEKRHNGWLIAGALILWFIIFVVIFWLILYSLQPPPLMKKGTNTIDTGKLLLAAVIIAFILDVIIGIIAWLVFRN